MCSARSQLRRHHPSSIICPGLQTPAWLRIPQCPVAQGRCPALTPTAAPGAPAPCSFRLKKLIFGGFCCDFFVCLFPVAIPTASHFFIGQWGLAGQPEPPPGLRAGCDPWVGKGCAGSPPPAVGPAAAALGLGGSRVPPSAERSLWRPHLPFLLLVERGSPEADGTAKLCLYRRIPVVFSCF